MTKKNKKTKDNKIQTAKKVKKAKSIKQKTALWYTYLYLLIAIISVIILSITLLRSTYKEVYKENSKIDKSITSTLKNGNFNDTEYIKNNLSKIEKKHSDSVIALINSNGNYYLLDKNEKIDNYIKGLKNNFWFELIPRASLLDKGYLVSSRDI